MQEIGYGNSLDVGIRGYGTPDFHIFGSRTTALMISNEEIEDITKTIKSLDKLGALLKGVSKIIENKTKR